MLYLFGVSCYTKMSSELLTESPRPVTGITNNDIRAVSSELTSSREDTRSVSSDKNRDSLECEPQTMETGDQTKSQSLTASSGTETIASQFSKTSKIISSSPDSNLKSSGTSIVSSGGVGAQQEIFIASVYNEIAESGATATPNCSPAPDLTEREAECLSTLMRLLTSKKHETTVHTATKFLMARKFDLVRAWGLYENHLHRRRKYKLDSLNPHEEPLRSELRRNKFMFIGTRDKQGRAISLFHARNHFPTESNPITVMQALSLHLDHALFDTTTQRQGIVLIYNMSGSGIKNLDYELAKELLDFLQEAYPARLHRTYVLNAPLWFRAAVRLFAPFLKKKVLDRLQMVNLLELHALLSPDSLPQSLGGNFKFSHDARLDLCVSHWLMHPFAAIPPSLTDFQATQSSSKPARTESLFTDNTPTNGSTEPKPPLPPKRCYSQLPSNAFSPITSVTDRHFNVPPTPSSADPIDRQVYQRQVPVLDEGDYPMTLQHLQSYMQTLGKRGIEEEYMKLRNSPSDGTFTNSVIPYNTGKNRYRDVPACDHSRVKLQRIEIKGESDPHDYINANHIDSYNALGAFIMCQGPIPNTVGDFWRMVWEQRVLNIIMVTRCTEGNRLKCAQYWPEIAEGEIKFNGVYVAPIDESPSKGFVIRRFSIRTSDSEPREITHFQYIAWPDYGVPEHGDEVLHLMYSVIEEQSRLQEKHFQGVEFVAPTGPPIVVHCSAGIGRSGTFCCIHSLIRQYKATGMVSIQGTVRKLRRQRAYSIQAPEQYSFIYHTIREYMEKNPTGKDSIPSPQVSIDGATTDAQL